MDDQNTKSHVRIFRFVNQLFEQKKLYTMEKNFLSRIICGCLCLIALSCSISDEDPRPDENILDVANQQPNLSTFVSALERTGIDSALTGNLNYTVFAPSNEAFASYLSRTGYGNINSVPTEILSDLLAYHTLGGIFNNEDFQSFYYITLSGNSPDSLNVSILIEALDTLTINGTTKVIESDLEAKNGVIHVIDEVLTPPTLLGVVRSNTNFSIFLEALQRTGFDDPLDVDNPLTIFAVPDGAFDLYFEDTPNVDDLSDLTNSQLRDLIGFHIMNGHYRGFNIGFQTIPTRTQGKSVEVSGDQSGLIVNRVARSLLLDVQATNGVMHVVDRVLIPD